MNEKEAICNFCGKSRSEVEHMILGPGVNICNECVKLFFGFLSDLDAENKVPSKQPGDDLYCD